MSEPSAASFTLRADGTVLGFDVGARRIGVAVGNALTGNATAIAVIDVHAGGPDWVLFDKLLREWRPDGLIVGDPMTLDGGDQPIRKVAKAFAQQIHARSGLPVAMIDERNSSQEAARRFAAARAAVTRKRRDADVLDAVAAAVIVERWLSAGTQDRLSPPRD